MVKPSVLSVGIGIGVLMLGGSGVAIPNLWSRANRAEIHRDQLQTSWQEEHEALVASDKARAAAEQQVVTLQGLVESNEEALRAADESKRILTSQLAATQEQNRELLAMRGTLALRTDEVAELVQELEQLRSDNGALRAEHEAVVATEDEAARPDVESVAVDDLVPVPRMTGRPVPTTNGDAEPAAAAKVSSKPTTAPIRFDHRGWKSVAASAANTGDRWPAATGITPPAVLPPQQVPSYIIVSP